MIVVSDNSVLSCLAEIGELDLLRSLYGKITVTETIRGEAMHASAPEDLRDLFSNAPDWIAVVPDEIPYLEETGALDDGEASAITLAWQHRENSLLILDERRGRKVASALGLPITGTSGLLADATAEGLIDFEDVFLRLAQSMQLATNWLTVDSTAWILTLKRRSSPLPLRPGHSPLPRLRSSGWWRWGQSIA